MFGRRAIWIVIVLLMPAMVSEAQVAQFAYRISFTDKTGSADINQPLSFLSQRALNRRSVQGLTVDNTDLPVSPRYIDSVLTITGGKMHNTSRWFNQCVILVTDSNKVKDLQGKPYVTGITYVGYYATGLHREMPPVEAPTAPPPFTTGRTTSDAAYYGSTWNQTEMVNGNYLHDRNYKGQGMLIAVLDAGFTHLDNGPTFDSIRQTGRLIDHYDFVLDDPNVYGYDTHGSFALSAMGGNLPGTYVGAAPLAEFVAYRTDDQVSTITEQPIELDNLVAAVERADSLGVNVINISLGYNLFYGPTPGLSLVYADLDGKTTLAAKCANVATSKGMLFVASAGNEGSNNWHYILTPGDADSALTIGSVNSTMSPAANSGWGPNAAGRRKPDVCAKGASASVMANGNFPYNINGTSFATPQIAGWAACLWQGMPSASPAQVRKAIIESAHLYTMPDDHSGYGVPDFGKAFQLLDIEDTPNNNFSGWIVAGPNPFRDQLFVKINAAANTVFKVALSDVSGRIIFRHEQAVTKGVQQMALNLPDGIPGGVYFLRSATDSQESAIKLLKQ